MKIVVVPKGKESPPRAMAPSLDLSPLLFCLDI